MRIHFLPLLALIFTACLPDRQLPRPAPPVANESGTVVINEIAPNEAPDWVEMANPSSQDLLMKAGEWFFSDDPTNKTKDTLKNDFLVPAQSYKLIECSTTSPQYPSLSKIYTAFSLSSTNGETFGIYHRRTEGSLETISEVAFPAGISGGSSFARKPDVSGSFQISSTQSPGQPNP